MYRELYAAFEMASWRLVRSAPDWGTLALAFIVSRHHILPPKANRLGTTVRCAIASRVGGCQEDSNAGQVISSDCTPTPSHSSQDAAVLL